MLSIKKSRVRMVLDFSVALLETKESEQFLQNSEENNFQSKTAY